MAVYEGRWDCPRCGLRGNRGSARACGGCGARRPVDVTFYLPEDEPAITSEAELREALAGPDWGCRHCGAGNGALDRFCTGCGAPRGADSRLARTDAEPWRDEPVARITRPQPSDGPPAWALYALLALFLGVVGWGGLRAATQPGGLLAAAATPRPTMVLPTPAPTATPLPDRVISATVTLRAWERSVAVEQHSVLSDAGWSVPAGARITGQSTRARGTTRVIDHYETRTSTRTERVQTGTETYSCGKENLGNGRFRDKTCTRAVYGSRTVTDSSREPVYRDDPVMDTWYTYEQDRWAEVRTVRASEGEPAWPALALAADEREGQRAERYSVRFEGSDERTYTWECDQATWAGLRQGQTYRLRVSGLGQPLRLEPAR